MLTRIFAVIAASLSVFPAAAADIAAKNGHIIVAGRLDRGDATKFKNVAKQIAGPTTVVFEGDGGNAAASLLIGEEISRRSFATLVKNDRICASACAFAWIAGNPRLMENKAKIGFHAVFVMKDGKPVVSAVANALVGNYMTKMGMQPPAIVFATEAAPEKMNWLTAKKATSLGIEVHEIVRP